MKVYIAAPYAARDHVRQFAMHQRLEVTSNWIFATRSIHPGTVDTAPDHSNDKVRAHVRGDLEDVDRADALLLLTGKWVLEQGWVSDLAQTISGGRHIETGYALAHGKLVVVVGQPENIFHRGACAVVPSLHEALTLLKGS